MSADRFVSCPECGTTRSVFEYSCPCCGSSRITGKMQQAMDSWNDFDTTGLGRRMPSGKAEDPNK